MQKKFNWEAFSKGDRNEVIDSVKNLISESDGYIMNFNMFSDLAINLCIEIEEDKVAELYALLGNEVNLSETEPPKPNSTSKKDCFVFLNLSFVAGKGELRQVIPEVPG